MTFDIVCTAYSQQLTDTACNFWKCTQTGK